MTPIQEARARMSGGLRAGDRAPDFTLSSTGEADITLSDSHGEAQVLPAFFPRVFSQVCTAEFCELSRESRAFRAYFVMDKRGIIRWEHGEKHPGVKRARAELLAALKQTTGLV